MSKVITVRFWFQSHESALNLCAKLASYEPKCIPYTGDNDTYKSFDYKVLFVLPYNFLPDLTQIVKTSLQTANFCELLADDEWVILLASRDNYNCFIKEYVLLEGLKMGNRFITTNDKKEDEYYKVRLNTGELVYKILGYADSIKEAQIKLWAKPSFSQLLF